MLPGVPRKSRMFHPVKRGVAVYVAVSPGGWENCQFEAAFMRCAEVTGIAARVITVTFESLSPRQASARV